MRRQVIRPSIDFMIEPIRHRFRDADRKAFQLLACPYPVQPGPPKVRVIEHPMDVRAPNHAIVIDGPILPRRGSAAFLPFHRVVQQKTGVHRSSWQGDAHVNFVSGDAHVRTEGRLQRSALDLRDGFLPLQSVASRT